MSAPVRRTGGRSAAVLSSIRFAVEELVRERGAEKVTIPLVAERAGVNPTSVYRRWGDAATMLNDIATYRLDPTRELPRTGDLRADLIAWCREIVEHYRKPINAALLRGGSASAGEQETECLRNRRAEGLAIAGEAGALDADDIIDGLVGPIVYRAIFLPWTLDEDLPVRLVDKVLAA
ncbi:TetR/AcrR family transcriptional regulator [Dactylosporangium vinaceum]|uniref:TetR/AcrR family transcriptional regulator n=1 Tax=Dactylosporangium vinaceum TaxID=53362 RepID=A0ABV5M1Q1_9ACTN|nr:TetR/AcrR family transcriptional regulator [Dactylosporangium vinaceum]UAB99279.1 TetR/AcrR family transcriptional regulator [Dactylosporangium vinaceum]